MRPRKKILLYCPNEVTQSVLRYQMDVWGYHVSTCNDMAEIAPALRLFDYDLVLLMPTFAQASWDEWEAQAWAIDELQHKRGHSTLIYDTHKLLNAEVATGIVRIPLVPRSSEVLRSHIRMTVSRRRKSVFRKPLGSAVVTLPEVAA